MKTAMIVLGILWLAQVILFFAGLIAFYCRKDREPEEMTPAELKRELDREKAMSRWLYHCLMMINIECGCLGHEKDQQHGEDDDCPVMQEIDRCIISYRTRAGIK